MTHPVPGIPLPAARGARPAPWGPPAGRLSEGRGTPDALSLDPDPPAVPLVAPGLPVVAPSAATHPNSRGTGRCDLGERDRDHRAAGRLHRGALALPMPCIPFPAARGARPAAAHPGAGGTTVLDGTHDAVSGDPDPPTAPLVAPGLPVMGGRAGFDRDFGRGGRCDPGHRHRDYGSARPDGDMPGATPSAGGPAPTTPGFHPASRGPSTARATSWVGLASTSEPNPATAVVLPAPGFPIRAGGTGTAHFDAGRRGADTYHDRGWCHGDSGGAHGDPGRSGPDHTAGTEGRDTQAGNEGQGPQEM